MSGSVALRSIHVIDMQTTKLMSKKQILVASAKARGPLSGQVYEFALLYMVKVCILQARCRNAQFFA